MLEHYSNHKQRHEQMRIWQNLEQLTTEKENQQTVGR